MQVNRKLNLVIPLERDSGTIYIHSTPILRDTFEKYFLVLSKTFSALYTEGLGEAAGPRVAAIMLKKIATNMGEWEGPEGVRDGLMAEIVRLSNVIAPGPNGWDVAPLQLAIDKGFIDGDDWSEAENILVFFIVVSAMHRKDDRKTALDMLTSLWHVRTSPLNCTEYAAGLPTLTETASSGETAQAS